MIACCCRRSWPAREQLTADGVLARVATEGAETPAAITSQPDAELAVRGAIFYGSWPPSL